MARKTKYYSDAKAEWEKANTYLFSTRLQRTTDADIIEKLEAAESRQGELKRLVRLGIAYEKSGADPTLAAQTEPLPEAYLKAINPDPDPETEELIMFGKEYKKLLDAGCVMVDRKMLERKPEPEMKAKPMIDLRKVVRGTVDNPGSVPDPD